MIYEWSPLPRHQDVSEHFPIFPEIVGVLFPRKYHRIYVDIEIQLA